MGANRNNVRGNVLEVNKKLNEDVMGSLRVMDKKIESIEETMKNFASKTNVSIYLDLAGQMKGYRELLKQVENTVNIAIEAAEAEHNKMVRISSGLDL